MKTGAGCCRLPDQSQHKATIYPCVFHTRMLTEGFPSGSGFHRPMIADKNVCVCVSVVATEGVHYSLFERCASGKLCNCNHMKMSCGFGG